jgi:sigma-B regulation protein RsbU (phosphoserine phosphatase)
MPDAAIVVSAACAIVVLATGIVIRQQRNRIHTLGRRLREFEGEELRMFSFLHDLGKAINQNPTPALLSRMIVDGVVGVINARGGAVYFLDESNRFLTPSYLSEDCPPLVGVPVEVRRKAERDPRVLESHIRLSRAAVDEGILGHCLAVGEAIQIEDVKSHPAFHDDFMRYGDDVSVLIAPLRHGGRDLGVLAIARRHDDGAFTGNDFTVFRSAAEQSSFALGNARLHREATEKRTMEDELRHASEVQRILLPQDDPVVAGFRISGTNLPARIISGDYYDYIGLDPQHTGIAIADVSGKGLPAGLLMAMCRSTLRSLAPGNHSPSAVLAEVNRRLFPDIREDMFISMAYAILNESDGRIVMSRAGHDPALWFHRASGNVEQLRPPGLALGVDEGEVFERVTKDLTIEMQAGDCLLLHTDGVREATDGNDNEFGMDRLCETFRLAAPLGAEAVLLRLQEELRKFTGDGAQMDDITLIAIERKRS